MVLKSLPNVISTNILNGVRWIHRKTYVPWALVTDTQSAIYISYVTHWVVIFKVKQDYSHLMS
jgi:hypothetical protein